MSEQKLTYSAFSYDELSTIEAILEVNEGAKDSEPFCHIDNNLLDRLWTKVHSAKNISEHMREITDHRDNAVLALEYDESMALQQNLNFMPYKIIKQYLDSYIRTEKEWKSLLHKTMSMPVAWNYMHGETQ